MAPQSGMLYAHHVLFYRLVNSDHVTRAMSVLTNERQAGRRQTRRNLMQPYTRSRSLGGALTYYYYYYNVILLLF